MVGPAVQSKADGGEEYDPKAVGKPKGPLAAREEDVLAFWNREKIFEKSLAKHAPKGEFIFYDGPPFANGLPHYGHILASAIKDAIPRYRTMRGYYVPRQWGWDCHGLPVENLVEKELGLKGKKDIEEYGIEKFNAAARVSIMKDVADWRHIIPRIGRWADMEHDYKTMDSSYTGSVWWAFKNLFDRGLAYEGFKAMHYCPRCGTTLANFEVAQGYEDIDDWAVTVKLPLVDEPDTSLLIWTTTPWTLPGNAAAAVGEGFEYDKVKVDSGFIIAAKGKVPGEVMKTYTGSELVGKRYMPPFDYYKNELGKNKNAWRVYAAPYVTLEDGTGIVHLAPAYGAEDLELAQQKNIPLIQHVDGAGRFVPMVKDFAGLPVKPKGRHLETDGKVIEALKAKGLLFKDEKIRHSYPHCWRCDTPLLNWAANSWFINVQKIKGKLLRENATIGWVPQHVGEGRFGKWLEGARDWAVSRSRYWGAPLPVWYCGKDVKVIGSVDELRAMGRQSGNRYTAMRHGEALHNVEHRLTTKDGALTAQGREEAAAAAKRLAKPTRIFASPLARTQETARIVAKELGVPESAITTDGRLRELNFGTFDNGALSAFISWRNGQNYADRPEGGESYADARRRFAEFLFELEATYKNETILIVTHGIGLESLVCAAGGWDDVRSMEYIKDTTFTTAQVVNLPFMPYPHNADYELDLHRPYIDDFDTGEWKRITDVFDCWFESGSMPFASRSYPALKSDFNPKGTFGFGRRGYPADFIAEGLDQTRGWFYSLIVLGTALFNKTPFKNVIVNGIVVAQDGQKMSKRLKNYPDPMEVVEQYGADSMRYFLLSSSVVRAEDLRFSEQGVAEVGKKLLMRLDNVRSFYELYADGTPRNQKSGHVLDRWILSRLGQLVTETTEGFETYQLDAASRPLAQFIDDLSTWYVRRSRDRFKEQGSDKDEALATLRHILIETAKVMAPIMPFFADDLYRRLRGESDPDSVHLCDWPEIQEGFNADPGLIEQMYSVRELASKGLELRERAGVKVRQPLGSLTVPVQLSPELAGLLAEELNVKEIRHGDVVSLDTSLTPELKEEGMYRDYVRLIQDWRKTQGLSITDRPGLLITTDKDIEFLRKFREALKDATSLISLEVKEGTETVLERL